MFKPTWMKTVFRDAEGEGAGGGASGAQDAPAPAPQSAVEALEQRLAQMASRLEEKEKGDKQREQQAALRNYETNLATNLKSSETAVADAEKALADAFDNGEGLEIAKAQRALSEATLAHDKAKNDVESYKQRLREQERRTGGSAPEPQGDLDDTNLNAWKTKHSAWYGVDADMTKAAHAIDRQIRDAGVISVGTKAYFDAVDREMSKRFPDKMGGTPNAATPGGQPPTQSRNRGAVSKSVAEGWRRMGINVDDPKVLDRMLQNRERAVNKGILPEQPVKGEIITR